MGVPGSYKFLVSFHVSLICLWRQVLFGFKIKNHVSVYAKNTNKFAVFSCKLILIILIGVSEIDSLWVLRPLIFIKALSVELLELSENT